MKINVLTQLLPCHQDEGLQSLRQEVQRYTTRTQNKISSRIVGLLIRDMMYGHLNLLTVLGCAAGIFLGVMSKITGVGQVLWDWKYGSKLSH